MDGRPEVMATVPAVCFRKSRRDDEGMLRYLLRSIPRRSLWSDTFAPSLSFSLVVPKQRPANTNDRELPRPLTRIVAFGAQLSSFLLMSSHPSIANQSDHQLRK